MQTPFDKTFDELLNALLTDYANQVDADGNPIDISKGSLAFIKSACTASALWGICKAQGYIADQIFPDSSDEANLEHHGSVRAVERLPSESMAAYLARLLEYIRQPPAGGNENDYVKWAKEVAGVVQAYCYPIARGLGTVDVVIVADISTGSEVPDVDLVAAVQSYIDGLRPTTAKDDLVIAAAISLQNVTMTTTGACDLAATADEITALLGSFAVDQKLIRNQLIAIALANGADDAVVTVPAADVVPAAYHMLRPGVISVT